MIGQLFFIAVYGHLRMLLPQWIVSMLSIQKRYSHKKVVTVPLFFNQMESEHISKIANIGFIMYSYFQSYFSFLFCFSFVWSLLFAQTLDICKNTFDEYVNDIKLNETIFWINVIDTCLQIKLFVTGLTTEKCPF